MNGWCKLDQGILTSSVWVEDHETLRLWICLLALADANGVAEGTAPGLANLCRLDLVKVEEILAKLAGPDRHSRSPENEGRRIQPIEGGWLLLNHAKYRAKRDPEERKRQVREAVARHRAKNSGRPCNPDVINVSHGKPPKAHTEAEAEAETDNGRRPADAGSDMPSNGNGSTPKRTGGATERERRRLEADPVLAKVGDAWAKAFGRRGRELGPLRAAKRAIAAGYDPKTLAMVAHVVSRARSEPERFSDRSSIRWTAEHNASPGYVWRPEVLDRLIPEAEAFLNG